MGKMQGKKRTKETDLHMKPSYTQIKNGQPFPLGATKMEGGWNFSVFSEHPVTSLCIASLENPNTIEEIPLDPELNQTGCLWHIFLQTDKSTLNYAYRVGENLLIDPYARLLDAGHIYGENFWKIKAERLYGIATSSNPFDWEGDKPLDKPQDELIIYEMHIRGFTKHASSKVSKPGTYLGLIEKIPYLKNLGVTALELLPVHEFDETEYDKVNPKTHERLYNYWGYSPINFFAPMQRYASAKEPVAGMNEFKEMVKALHAAEIEVILDVVFNHTGEGNENGKVVSWKGFAQDDYYLIGKGGDYLNFSGCGNTFHCNSPIVQDLIIESLRYWVTEFHVDGFRFDLASILSRGRDGRPLAEPPLLERITQDPILKHSWLIAEPWDAVGLHQVGSFYQSIWKGASHWIEWNDDYRSVVRRFIKGDAGLAGKFATKLCGSQDVYGCGGTPLNGINFITCHDGFTLRDLVSCDYKHNLANGEDNRDGANNNDSWNCGSEGDTQVADIVRLRERQMKNFILALMVSQGVPMIQMGDEYGHTKGGNNNTWCQDNLLNWFKWDELNQSQSFYNFYKELIQFRKTQPLLRRATFINKADIEWHGINPFDPDWTNDSHFVAFTLKDKVKHEDIYIAFNASHEEACVTLPSTPKEMVWTWVVNTQKAPSQDFIDPALHIVVESDKIKLNPNSAVLLLAQAKVQT